MTPTYQSIKYEKREQNWLIIIITLPFVCECVCVCVGCVCVCVCRVCVSPFHADIGYVKIMAGFIIHRIVIFVVIN